MPPGIVLDTQDIPDVTSVTVVPVSFRYQDFALFEIRNSLFSAYVISTFLTSTTFVIASEGIEAKMIVRVLRTVCVAGSYSSTLIVFPILAMPTIVPVVVQAQS